MNQEELERAILDFVHRPDYRPLKPRQIAKRLNFSKEAMEQARKIVKQLVKRGELAYGAQHLVKPVTSEQGSRVTGIFRRVEQGHGYVTPRRGDGQANADFYIPAKESRDASTGDLVLVQLAGKIRRGRRVQQQGFIVEIIERDTHRFVGTYFESGGEGFVDVDGALFRNSIAVGDPGAKGARPDDKVVFEMIRFPSHYFDGEGAIVQVLGARGEPGVDTLSVIHEYQLPDAFGDDVLDEARRVVDAFDESLEGREDLSDETIITIDPVDARDFDDAISLERDETGQWTLGVHIADVSHFVQPGSLLDREARNRATSVYLPDRVLPMLPEAISNGVASLQPDRLRYALSVFLHMTAEGALVEAVVKKTAIRSCRRFTYEEVDGFLENRATWKKKLEPPVFELLGRMHELAMVLRRRRAERGALELSLRELAIDLDQDGRVVGAHRVENTESHQIIEEFMLAANEAVADLLDRKGWSFLRRVHPLPDDAKLQMLSEFVGELGYKTDGLTDRFELQSLLAAVEGKPEQAAVNFAVLRSMKQAIYSPAVDGHYALAAEHYCHFTSPIRRYPDLTVHRLLERVLTGGKPPDGGDELVVLAQHCSDRERRAEEAERELKKTKLLAYLSDHVGDRMPGLIVGVERFGFFVEGVDLPAQGLVHVATLTDDRYRFDRSSHSLVGFRRGNVFRLGDRVTVEVAQVDVHRRELDFRLVQRGWPKSAARPKRKTKRKPTAKAAPKRKKARKKSARKKAVRKKTTTRATGKKTTRRAKKSKRRGK